MNRKEIGSSLYLTQLPNTKFKRNKISINFMVPNERKTATMYALQASSLIHGPGHMRITPTCASFLGNSAACIRPRSGPAHM